MPSLCWGSLSLICWARPLCGAPSVLFVFASIFAHNKEMETLQGRKNEQERKIDAVTTRVEMLEAEGKGVQDMMHLLLVGDQQKKLFDATSEAAAEWRMEATNAAHVKQMETLQRRANEHETRIDAVTSRGEILEAEGKGVHEMVNVLIVGDKLKKMFKEQMAQIAMLQKSGRVLQNGSSEKTKGMVERNGNEKVSPASPSWL